METQPFSVGSAGHPYTCSNPCKYVWRKQGCRDGTDCPNCHYCKWQRRPKDEVPVVPAPTASVSENLEAMAIPPPPGLGPPEPEMSSQQKLGKVQTVGVKLLRFIFCCTSLLIYFSQVDRFAFVFGLVGPSIQQWVPEFTQKPFGVWISSFKLGFCSLNR